MGEMEGFRVKKICLIALALAAVGTQGVTGQDLFEEAGHALGHSRWVGVRLLPLIEIALEADDVVLVRSIEHPAKSFAMRIDGNAVAADCEVTEKKDTGYTMATESKNKKWLSGVTSTLSTFWARCQFDDGVATLATEAAQIVVQIAMTNGTTKPHTLKPKELSKFQRMDR